MLTISKPVGRGRNGDEDIVGKDSGLLIALVCDRTLQSIILVQISSSFSPKERKSQSFVQSSGRIFGQTRNHGALVHKPKVRPFFSPRVSHFLKVRTLLGQLLLLFVFLVP